MIISNNKQRQLRIQYDTEKLAQLGQEMAQKGQVSLKVQKERLSVSSLSFLKDFKHLESISIYGIAKNISILADMPNLQSIALCGLSIKDVNFLGDLKNLKEIWIQGFQLKDWDSFRNLKQIKAITLFNLRHDNFVFLEDMENLQIIVVNRCSKVKNMPSLEKLIHLRRVIFETVNRLEDISGISKAPILEDVVVGGADSLPPEAFDCFVNHHSIKRLLPGIGSTNSNKFKKAISRLPNELLMNGFYGTENENFSII